MTEHQQHQQATHMRHVKENYADILNAGFELGQHFGEFGVWGNQPYTEFRHPKGYRLHIFGYGRCELRTYSGEKIDGCRLGGYRNTLVRLLSKV